MHYQLLGDSDSPIVQIALQQGEEIRLERGAMAYMSNIELSGKLNANKKGLGSLVHALGRSFVSGESMFISSAIGQSSDSYIGLAPATPGKIYALEVGQGTQYRLNTGAFLACDAAVTYNMVRQKISGALFGGTGGFFVMETTGTGTLFVSSFGDLIELDVQPNKPITIDNEHVVAWDTNLDYTIRIASGTFGFKTGEGLVNDFYGSGKVLVKTRSLQNLADAMSGFFPSSSGE